MMNITTNLLPYGMASFSALRDSNKIYVDKTDLIYSLASNRGVYFLSRPRRFGKTLLLSTFDSLFRDGLQEFKGLAIEKLWEDKNTYNVVRLNFAKLENANSVSEFNTTLNKVLNNAFTAAGIPFSSKFADDAYANLEATIPSIKNNSVVLLIDEYDAPLNHNLDNLELFTQLQGEMSKLFQTFKDDTFAVKLRFYFITGITRYSHTGCFSGLNNLTDLTLSPKYGALLGYTEEEIDLYFKDYLKEIESELSISHAELIRLLRENYDGFCFEKTAKVHVYAPWSTLSFLQDLIVNGYSGNLDQCFENYWFSSAGKPDVIKKYFNTHSIDELLKKDSDFCIAKDNYSSLVDLTNLNADVLLAQTGYFSIKDVTDSDFIMGLPNNEIAKSISKLIIEILTQKDLTQQNLSNIEADLRKGNTDNILDKLNRLFNNIVYDNGNYVSSEHYVRSITQAYLIGFTYNMQAEKHNAFGRRDLEFDKSSYHYVFEFKFSKDGKNADKLLNEGIEQVKSNHYGEGDLTGRKLIRIVLVYQASEKHFTRHTVIDE